MEQRPFGKTGLTVSALGFGAAQIGYLGVSQAEATRLLNTVLDAGVTVIDTAACYANSESLIGNAIAGRRDQYTLVSKCGHHVADDDPPEWTPELVRRSAERSLRLLKTDRLDALLLHSCDAEYLDNPALIEAMLACKRDGLTRLIGYSGENKAADKAIALGVFDCLETSVNFCDQQALDRWLSAAQRAGMGVFVKRPLANTAWRDLSTYAALYADYARPYAERLKALGFTPQSLGFEGDWIELALRFSAWQSGVSTVLVGSVTAGHLQENIETLARGPLPDAIVRKLRALWKQHDDGTWSGQM